MADSAPARSDVVRPLRGIALLLFALQLGVVGAVLEFFAPLVVGVLVAVAGVLLAFA